MKEDEKISRSNPFSYQARCYVNDLWRRFVKPHYESKKLCLAVLIAMLFFSSSGYSVVILKWVEDSGTRLPIAVSRTRPREDILGKSV
ncbi:MAG: hypothetical protein PHQ39_11730, partial [Methanothrix soehngenii]|nr:hypothetical protein [Methanothrix soehngenii]